MVITGIGVVSAGGIGKDHFWNSLQNGKSAVGQAASFDTSKFDVKIAGEIKDFNPEDFFSPKSLRNLDRNALFLAAAYKQAIEDSRAGITQDNTDKFGIVTGTTFSHLWPIFEFDREVFVEGINFANPALFPSTVINAASSQASILFNIQGFNTTISTGFVSALSGLNYARDALSTGKAETIFSGSVDTLTYSLFLGFYKLGYMSGLKGVALSCPFDKRRNGPVLAEAAVSFCVESAESAEKRKAPVLAVIRGIGEYFDAFQMSKVNPRGEGLERAIEEALSQAGINTQEIGYVSSCANSSVEIDKVEAKVLHKIFGSSIKKVPVSSIKSMLGETFSASAGLQVASCIGVFKNGIIPPTINFKEKDDDCDIDCVPNKAVKKDVKTVLVTSFGPGGYSSACVLTKQ